MLLDLLKMYELPAIRSKAHLLSNLQWCYALMLATEGLLEAAKMSVEDERGHADWLAKDIVDLGGTLPTFDYAAACVAGAQYYLIYHVHPLLLLGYRAALECHPMPLDHVEQLEELYGPIPCLRYHAMHDVAHSQVLLRRIEEVEPTLKTMIYRNAEATAASNVRVLQQRFSHIEEGVSS